MATSTTSTSPPTSTRRVQLLDLPVEILDDVLTHLYANTKVVLEYEPRDKIHLRRLRLRNGDDRPWREIPRSTIFDNLLAPFHVCKTLNSRSQFAFAAQTTFEAATALAFYHVKADFPKLLSTMQKLEFTCSNSELGNEEEAPMVWAIQLQEFIAGGLLPALSVIMLKVKCYGELPQWEKGRMVKIEELEDENHIGYWEEVVKSAPKNINMLLAVNGRRFEKGSYITLSPLITKSTESGIIWSVLDRYPPLQPTPEPVEEEPVQTEADTETGFGEGEEAKIDTPASSVLGEGESTAV